MERVLELLDWVGDWVTAIGGCESAPGMKGAVLGCSLGILESAEARELDSGLVVEEVTVALRALGAVGSRAELFV